MRRSPDDGKSIISLQTWLQTLFVTVFIIWLMFVILYLPEIWESVEDATKWIDNSGEKCEYWIDYDTLRMYWNHEHCYG